MLTVVVLSPRPCLLPSIASTHLPTAFTSHTPCTQVSAPPPSLERQPSEGLPSPAPNALERAIAQQRAAVARSDENPTPHR